ncbi:hypothetical protein AB9F35_33505, partial [Rhizobium leguminosarum]
HKIFRSFTYMGSRGAAFECVSAIDIALWDIQGKVLGKPISELLCGPVRDEIALYTHPNQAKGIHWVESPAAWEQRPLASTQRGMGEAGGYLMTRISLGG